MRALPLLSVGCAARIIITWCFCGDESDDQRCVAISACSKEETVVVCRPRRGWSKVARSNNSAFFVHALGTVLLLRATTVRDVLDTRNYARYGNCWEDENPGKQYGPSGNKHRHREQAKADRRGFRS
ncbi:hypothetical protein PUNSTDRAFT_55333 [Punctularia strigosozonata HHB-11173 SS5]|uniref:Secreted protein n=1 Tax=Punctularia strigosozonata (strain HHB-11173) TaxID=741275 RepID=R7S5D3_PUNST|nr:uncharacterized protein PUNSTDRAFT_55333 [Punctularia strigosozonata HHB-11173 SS5]EIN04591.1 hypothetical protein PUNSTDRAFT_55333 [Punctularia strigosozonata HHB-11173 SS5]